jgi:hypothetical protein
MGKIRFKFYIIYAAVMTILLMAIIIQTCKMDIECKIMIRSLQQMNSSIILADQILCNQMIGNKRFY